MKKILIITAVVFSASASTAFAVMCNGVNITLGPMQSLGDNCQIINQRGIDCGRNPGVCGGGTNSNSRWPVVTGVPLDAAWYAQQIQNALTARYWDEYIRAQNARTARIMAESMRSSRPSTVRPRPEVLAGVQRTQSTGEGGSSQTNTVVSLCDGMPQRVCVSPRYRMLGCHWDEGFESCSR